MFSKSDVYIKTQSGIEEVKLKTEGALHREARILLILIDNNKTYGALIDSLKNSKTFKESGGVEQYFQLLLNLKYIELKEANTEQIKEVVLTNKVTTKPKKTKRPTNFQTLESKSTILQREKDKARDDQSEKSKPNIKSSDIRAKLASIIKKDSQPEDSQRYLSHLKQCKNRLDILFLIREIQKENSGELARSMGRAAKYLKRKRMNQASNEMYTAH